MKISRDTLEVGGMIVVPGSFCNTKDPGEIIGKTHVGVNVVYNKGKTNQQLAFYSYSWLNYQYGDKEETEKPKSSSATDMPNDDLPWNL